MEKQRHDSDEKEVFFLENLRLTTNIIVISK
jgi:hypothetical protein